jgi:cytidyltransferase-like protein
MDSKKTILVLGTFDIFHQGHYYFLSCIHTLIKNNSSDNYKLIVGLYSSAMSFNKNGYFPIKSYIERKEVLSNIEYISDIVYIDSPIPLYIKELEPTIIALGFSQGYIKDYLKNYYEDISIIDIPSYNTDIYVTCELRNKYIRQK